LKQEH